MTYKLNSSGRLVIIVLSLRRRRVIYNKDWFELAQLLFHFRYIVRWRYYTKLVEIKFNGKVHQRSSRHFNIYLRRFVSLKWSLSIFNTLKYANYYITLCWTHMIPRFAAFTWFIHDQISRHCPLTSSCPAGHGGTVTTFCGNLLSSHGREEHKLISVDRIATKISIFIIVYNVI